MARWIISKVFALGRAEMAERVRSGLCYAKIDVAFLECTRLDAVAVQTAPQ
jgi:hypothetical protein